ncbi:MAG TPA: hypothetical protein PKI03_37310 [Pseudomonadota bacterium]|nr:hypothetical protein [Pseudomonadota bacterium]
MNKADSLLLQTRLSELLTGMNQKIPQIEYRQTVMSGLAKNPIRDSFTVSPAATASHAQ